MAKKWVHIPADGIEITGPGNYVLNGEDFYISYAPDISGNPYNHPSDNTGDETALVQDGRFLILKGDWRDQYEALVDEGYEACVALYRAHKAQSRSRYSNDPAPALSH